ncbi:MAG TPA: hypothetical protein VHC63_10730 [Acidimicrobiales bacterium]|nr:hypothetical protein [Acidimicrobiales bacterium]
MTAPRSPRPTSILRGYGPFFMLAMLVLMMAVFVPSKVQSVRDQSLSADQAPGDTGSDVTAPGETATTVAGATGNVAAKATPPRTNPCTDRAQQIPGDPYSPPCATFSGSNGGATTRGVTGTEVHLAIRQTSDASLDDAIAEVVGTDIADTPDDVKRTLDVLAEYFNKHFQFYGRHIVLDYFQGQGSLAAELLGNGRDKAEVDATRVATELKSFADLTALTEPYADALARQKVMNFGSLLMSREWYTQRRPYSWSPLPDCSTVVEDATEYVLKRLSGGNADLAGGDIKGKPRRITIIAPENAWYQECVKAAEKVFAAAGHPLEVDPIAYQLDISTFSNQATNIVAKLRSENVTTILCGCDPIFPIFLSGDASRDNYFPEFVSGYELDIVGQLWDAEFTKHSFGISPLGPNVSQPPYSTIGYAAYKSLRSDEPAHSVDSLYYQMYLFAIGVQLAGPNLTPATFEKGMFTYGDHLGPAGLWNFGPGDYTPMDDFHEIYWDPNKISPYNSKPGAWADPEPGKRYRHGANQMTPGPPKIPQS